MKSIGWIKVKLQKTIKPNISNKSKNILGVDRVDNSCKEQSLAHQGAPTMLHQPAG